MAHARRKFDEALENDQDRAGYVLTQMQKLYSIEQTGRGQSISFEELYALRQQQALQILESLKAWMLIRK